MLDMGSTRALVLLVSYMKLVNILTDRKPLSSGTCGTRRRHAETDKRR